MTALDLGTGAVLILGGVGIGWKLPRTRPGTCQGCSHPLGCRSSFGECTRKIRVRAYTASGRRNGWKYEKCGCRAHSEPSPLDVLAEIAAGGPR